MRGAFEQRLTGLGHSKGHLGYGVMVELLVLPAIAWMPAKVFGVQERYFDTVVLPAAFPVSSISYVLAVRGVRELG